MAQATRVQTDSSLVSATDFEQEIFSLADNRERTTLLVYGDSNAGKTRLAGTCPGRCFWLVCEPGYRVAPRHGAKGKGVVVDSSARAIAALDWLRKGSRPESIDWIIVDGITTMQDRIRLAYTAEAYDLSAGQAKRARAHRNLPDRPDYFNTQNFLKWWVPHLLEIGPSVLVTAHAYRSERTEIGDLKVFPGFQGREDELANNMMGLFDATGYLTRHKDRRILLWDRVVKNDVLYVTGNKLELPAAMSNPDMTSIINAIESGG